MPNIYSILIFYQKNFKEFIIHNLFIGFMTRIELEMFSAVPNLEFNTYWIPCTWFISLLKDARKGNKITDPQGLKLIMQVKNNLYIRSP